MLKKPIAARPEGAEALSPGQRPGFFEVANLAPFQVGCSKFRYKSDIKSAKIQLVKLLIFNTLYCEIVL